MITADPPILEASDLARRFPGPPPVDALRSVSLSVHAGEMIAILGPSGSGKSTLLNVLGLLDMPTSGKYRLLGQDVQEMNRRSCDKMRAETIGFVFQESHVLRRRTVAENIALKMQIIRTPRSARRERIGIALETVGMSRKAGSLAEHLSGGERQRVAIARALVGDPPLLLADEPTGNLDVDNSQLVVATLRRIAESGRTVIMITHDLGVASHADRTARIVDGVMKDTE